MAADHSPAPSGAETLRQRLLEMASWFTENLSAAREDREDTEWYQARARTLNEAAAAIHEPLPRDQFQHILSVAAEHGADAAWLVLLDYMQKADALAVAAQEPQGWQPMMTAPAWSETQGNPWFFVWCPAHLNTYQVTRNPNESLSHWGSGRLLIDTPTAWMPRTVLPAPPVAPTGENR